MTLKLATAAGALMAGLALSACQTGSQEIEVIAAADAGPTPATLQANAAVRKELDFASTREIDFAERGFIATRADPLIKAADGHVVWDLSKADALQGEAPDTVNPSLWRNAQLMAKHGLFKSADDVYQVRGFDLANVTFVKGDSGWIVIDPLTSNETARAAYDLISEQIGQFPISAILYTHSHGDHFGGAEGLLEFGADSMPIIAPAGFMEESISENLLAGTAMRRRAMYHVASSLDFGPDGTVGSGLGAGLATGTLTMVPPTQLVDHTGQELTIDGVRMVFQVTSGTEAPAEFNVGFPDLKVVNIAENANPSQHNILTPRGAKVRDPKLWADGLTEAIDMFGYADTLVVSHGWPRFGQEEIADYLSKQRDAYKFLHDQTLRLMNQGYTGDEIAATLKLPDVLASEWYNRPHYGDFSFNVRAVYQRYLGFFDGNPVHLAPLPPEDAAKKYVAAMGGADNVQAMAQQAFDEGDFVWASTLLNHLVFSDGKSPDARALLSDTYDQLGWQAENAIWRNFYLSAAKELREGVAPPEAGMTAQSASVIGSVPTSDLFDIFATQLNPERSEGKELKLGFVFPDRGEEVTLTVKNSVMTFVPHLTNEKLDATLTANRSDFIMAIAGGGGLMQKIQSGEAKLEGNPLAFKGFTDMMDKPDPAFNIVTP